MRRGSAWGYTFFARFDLTDIIVDVEQEATVAELPAPNDFVRPASHAHVPICGLQLGKIQIPYGGDYGEQSGHQSFPRQAHSVRVARLH